MSELSTTPDSSEERGQPPKWRRFDLSADQHDQGLQAAQQALAAGQLVVLPTDTVYGIAADALQPDAVQGLLDAKHRGRDMPPPVLIAEAAMLRALVADVTVEVDALINRFWPGALTLIMKAQPSLRMDLGKTEGTIAVRVPDQAETRELLRQTGPLAVSSANISGRSPATSIDEAIEQLGDSVAVYLDGGTTPGPTASTIIDLAGATNGRIVRAGVLGYAQLATVMPNLADIAAPQAPEPAPSAEPQPEPESSEDLAAGPPSPSEPVPEQTPDA
ncbi:L-threonylcarbamoyladenylate synthase [Propionimicrobium sp. PCR01-08-3]|uniref:L-threonylcarbamoyladenylate synthase n=1 Tax=Propionimicrobium sp. PCR01-08-3 TaxID=3052086 RepID=UPI00255C78E3|nr:L-threonylcarbamoyladenylate synthase [Propionimicrobium sp. PCR01-08-3]WIY83812.1 L-threonylcarbamoyladenylate synthase [Propionimicrobium sp. PCR01-08-3]